MLPLPGSGWALNIQESQFWKQPWALGPWLGVGGKGAGSRGSTGSPVLSVGRDLPFPVLCSFLWGVFLVSTELLLLSWPQFVHL